jgi:hypothetical protein
VPALQTQSPEVQIPVIPNPLLSSQNLFNTKEQSKGITKELKRHIADRKQRAK